MDIQTRLDRLRGLPYSALMMMLEAQVKKAIQLEEHLAAESDTIEEILALLTVAMPLNSGKIEVKSHEVEMFLTNLLEALRKEGRAESKVVSIWEDF